MTLCTGGFPEDLVLKWEGYNTFWNIRYDESPRDFHSTVTVSGNAPTGYYSNKAKCSPYPGSSPGNWRSPNEWVSACHNYVKHELTLVELYYNACRVNNSHGEREDFCNSIEDIGGNKRRPIACGGTDPDIFTYNPVAVAQSEVSGALGDLQSISEDIASEAISKTRKNIAIVTVVLIAIILILIVIFKKQ